MALVLIFVFLIKIESQETISIEKDIALSKLDYYRRDLYIRYNPKD